jgi:hypothetical protein
MGNLFVAIPAPAANGSGAAVDVSAFGAKKTFTVANAGVAHVTIEMSNEAVPVHWAPVWTFQTPNDKTLEIAARWMRATVSNYKPGGPAPVVNLGGNDDGTTSVTLIAPAVDGAGAAVDVSLLPEFKTVQVAEQFKGSVQIEISEDAGATWNGVYSFSDPGQQTQVFTANRMRVTRNGVTPGGPVPIVNVTATVPGGGGGGGMVIGAYLRETPILNQEAVAVIPGQPMTQVGLRASTVGPNFQVVGLVKTGAAPGSTASLVAAGPLTLTAAQWDAVTGGIGGLIPGARYFVAPGAAGMLTNMAPDPGTGDTDKPVGFALNATTMAVICSGDRPLETNLEGVPFGTALEMNFGTGFALSSGGGGVVNVDFSGGGGALGYYGTGDAGDFVTAGDMTLTTENVPGAPPTVTSGNVQMALFNDLEISPGDTLSVGDLFGAPGDAAVIIYVKGTLTIGAGGALSVDGQDAAGSVGGLGRVAPSQMTEGLNGANGFAAPSGGANGQGTQNTPAYIVATSFGGAGGDTTNFNGGARGAPDTGNVTWPYTLAALSTLYDINEESYAGGSSGASGASEAASTGGGGGGGAGVLVICARNIVAPAGSIRARGGNGAAGAGAEAGGGGGGAGGLILIITENTTLAGVCDVSGGAGGAGAGIGMAGEAGGDGYVIAINPSLGPIPT